MARLFPEGRGGQTSHMLLSGKQSMGYTWEMATPLAGSPRGAASRRGNGGKSPGHVLEGHLAGGWPSPPCPLGGSALQ